MHVGTYFARAFLIFAGHEPLKAQKDTKYLKTAYWRYLCDAFSWPNLGNDGASYLLGKTKWRPGELPSKDEWGIFLGKRG